MTIEVRVAEPKDCREILRLIQELADYEKMSDGPQLDTDTFCKDGFNKRSFYKCIVAEEHSENVSDAASDKSSHLIGYVLYFFALPWSGKCVYMEDLYVTPQHRSKGIGSKLWKAVIQAGLALGANSCRFAVLDWNTSSLDFYCNKGAQCLSEGDDGLQLMRFTKLSMEQISSSKMDAECISVREAGAADLPSLLDMYKRLQDSLLSSTIIKTHELEGAVSGSLPTQCTVLVGVSSSGIVTGFLTFYYTYSTWEGRTMYLQSVYAQEQRRATGTHLMKTAMTMALSEGCSRCDLVLPKTCQSGLKFFDSLGALNLSVQEGWLCMTLHEPHMNTFIES